MAGREDKSGSAGTIWNPGTARTDHRVPFPYQEGVPAERRGRAGPAEDSVHGGKRTLHESEDHDYSNLDVWLYYTPRYLGI